jgi:hypothetical protein
VHPRLQYREISPDGVHVEGRVSMHARQSGNTSVFQEIKRGGGCGCRTEVRGMRGATTG